MAKKSSASAVVGGALLGASFLKKNKIGPFGSDESATSGESEGIKMADVSSESPVPESSAPIESDVSSASADADTWKNAAPFANGGMIGHGDRCYGKKR
jgi:hypothetical protein